MAIKWEDTGCVCSGKRYLVCERPEGRDAVERCDTCSKDSLTDVDAAKLAQRDGIACETTYPCYVTGDAQ